jgi:solute carrier family 13 (sodium-dependent dicarboxylate transporter), member 2/3/5
MSSEGPARGVGDPGRREGRRSGRRPRSSRERDVAGGSPAKGHEPLPIATASDEGEVADPRPPDRRAWTGRILGPVLALLVYVLIPSGEGGLGTAGRGTAAVGVLMAVWWISEALPLPATSLLPIALFPLVGVFDVGEATAPYADDIIFLFMGGFMLALAMQRWGLHRRIALVTIMAVGTRPVQVVGGFMLATAFLSMWVSNTATTVMMLPIGLSVLHLVAERAGADGREADEAALGVGHGAAAHDAADGRGTSRRSRGGADAFATCLMLAIAYAASIGSLATLIGTPPNLFMAGFLEQSYGITIGFGRWMLIGLPLSTVFLVITWLVLTRVVYPIRMHELPGGRELFRAELRRLGPVGRGERIVATVFVLTAAAWVLREPVTGALTGVVPNIGAVSDAGIAVTAAILLFAIPVDWRAGVFTLDWPTARQLPWGVLLLFGGGLSLAAAVRESGLDAYIGLQVGGLGGLPLVLLIAAVVTSIVLLTELTSNTATAATFLPILAGAAVGLGITPLLLVVPAALAASCAFMMPVATPPNAIVFGSGHVTMPQMVRAGVWLNLVGIVLVTATILVLGGPVLGL